MNNKKLCLICRATLHEVIDFGPMPIANGFLSKNEFNDEAFFPLRISFCRKCLMVQLMETVDKNEMFHDHYAFFSSSSNHMQTHFKELAQDVYKRYLSKRKDPFVVEIGSNDGILLKHFSKRRIRHLGIEPSKNVANEAVKKGVTTISEFFDESLADKIIRQSGYADLYLGANVMCHIPYIHSVVAGIKKLLKPDGLLIFEDPYIGDIIKKTSYDQMYDEHAFYFSVQSVDNLMKMHDMEVTDVKTQNVHGGSMRYTISHLNTFSVKANVKKQIEFEKKLGLDSFKTYINFKKNVLKSKKNLNNLLKKLKNQKKAIFGYGATSKSTTVLNFCGISSDLISGIYDTTPIKIGKFSPGVHIPILDYAKFSKNYSDVLLLFAWNHAKEIFEKEQQYRINGGKFILFVPEVKII